MRLKCAADMKVVKLVSDSVTIIITNQISFHITMKWATLYVRILLLDDIDISLKGFVGDKGNVFVTSQRIISESTIGYWSFILI